MQVASKESKNSPLILFVKEAEKSMIGNPDAYAAFKSKLENLPKNIVVIASNTQTDARKEKVSNCACGVIHFLIDLASCFCI